MIASPAVISPDSGFGLKAEEDRVLYRNRESAGFQLASKIQSNTHEHIGSNPLILALPRSGLPLGRVIADELNGELDIALVAKLKVPGKYGGTVGAVSEFGDIFTEAVRGRDAVTQTEILRLAAKSIEDLQKRRALLTPLRPMRNPRGRDVVLVDDGIITGSSVLAALHSIRACHPRRLILATAIAPRALRPKLEAAADSYVVLFEPNEVLSVTPFFSNPSDEWDDTKIAMTLMPPHPRTLEAQI